MKTRIWNCTKAFPGKVNFIDDNNVVLGYDLEQDCCEYAFWTISESPDGTNPIYGCDNKDEQEFELEGYSFDPNFCQMDDKINRNDEEYVTIFKLVAEADSKSRLPDLFLRLENHHNGYYSHGFTFSGAVVVKGSL